MIMEPWSEMNWVLELLTFSFFGKEYLLGQG